MSIVDKFDSVCLHYGDCDAVKIFAGDKGYDGGVSFCYLEFQEYSKALAAQLRWRFRPAYVLVDCRGHVGAEIVALLACMRIGVPFVPVSASDQHAQQGRMGNIVKTLRENSGGENVAAIVSCDNDQDPILGVFENAGIHQVLFVGTDGNLKEALNVPGLRTETDPKNDDLYVLFTSGTSGNSPKAVVGSQKATLNRLQWFHEEFDVPRASSKHHRIGRRTRLTFVDSITELFGALLFPPAQLVAVNPLQLEEEGLVALLNLDITQLTLLPSQLGPLLSTNQNSCLSKLKRVVISGEPCNASLLEQFQCLCPDAQLINLYGQTETTGDVLYTDLTSMVASEAVQKGIVAVGKPLPGCRVHCTADNELVVSGSCLSNGYFGKERFEVFDTGDIGFCSTNGVWYVQGRKGDVKKVNGILTSPAEVETAMAQLYPSLMPVAATVVNGNVYAISECDCTGIFNRQDMNEKGRFPWNLIPKQIWRVPRIPRSVGGAAKIDRSCVRYIIEEKLHTHQSGLKGKEEEETIESILARVLMQQNELDLDKSFAELGGDSATAVTLLYELRYRKLCCGDLTATNILQMESMHMLTMKGSIAKRQKREHSSSQVLNFESKPIKRYSKAHFAVEFRACVDASPIVHGMLLYGACQGGVVVRIDLESFECRHFHFRGWMVKADLIIVNDLLIICAHNRSGEGLVCMMSLDLAKVIWRREYTCGTIKTTPTVLDDKLYVTIGKQVVSLCLETGQDMHEASTKFPHSITSRALVLENSDKGGTFMCYASSDWETGISVMETSGKKVNSLSVELGPVYKNALNLSPSQGVVTDSYGNLHIFDLFVSKSYQLASGPLSAPTIVGDFIIVGGYDGVVRCLELSDPSTVKWEQSLGAIIYARPLSVPNGKSFVVCTTAGDVVQLSIQGFCLWRGKVDAEIWSDPSFLSDNLIAFGARDSRLHIMNIE